jgi:hypothetical protein
VVPNQGSADRHQTINQSPQNVSHRNYRVPKLPMVQAVSIYSILHALPTDGSHGNDLSSAPYRGSLIRVGGGLHDGSMTGIHLLGWNREIGPHASMFQVGWRRPSGQVQTLQCLRPSPCERHSLLYEATGTALSAQGSSPSITLWSNVDPQWSPPLSRQQDGASQWSSGKSDRSNAACRTSVKS